ncbi:MAG: glycosyltransferase [Candidatus Methanofastidiosum sp.]|nr:glycosyltransferase [Methanofastidiosum sp.]
MKTAVLTVVYQGVEPYIHDFLISLQSQTDNDFDLVLVDDGFYQLQDCLSHFSIRSRVLYFEGSFVGIRKQAIRWLAAEDYDYVVFADSDDYFDWQRIKICKELLNTYDLVCNELVLFGANLFGMIPMASSRFYEGQEISADHLWYGNIMGMSNTGARLAHIIPYIDMIPDDIVALDWMLYSLALLHLNTCVFTKRTKTYYRQHTNNIAAPQNYSEEQIIRGVRIKCYHYQILARYKEDYYDYAKQYQRLLTDLDNVGFREKYCRAVRTFAPSYPLWWEAIKLAEELDL